MPAWATLNITGYRIEWFITGTGWVPVPAGQVEVNVAGKSAIVTGLKPETNYQFRLRAVQASGTTFALPGPGVSTRTADHSFDMDRTGSIKNTPCPD